MNHAPGQQLDLFAPPADPPKLIDLMRVLVSTSAARPKCGCVSGFVQRVGVHTGLYCGGHGRWPCSLRPRPEVRHDSRAGAAA